MTTTPDTDHSIDASRRIHRTLGGTTPFWRNYTIGELALFAMPALVGGFILGLPFVPATVLVPTVVGVLASEAGLLLLFRVRPAHLRLTEWLTIQALWLTSPRAVTLGDDSQGALGVTRLRAITPHGIERDDGALVGAVRIEPANLALADGETWTDAVRSFTTFVDGSLDFDVRFHIGTRPLDDHAFITDHKNRLDDPDIEHSPVLAELLDRFVEARTDDEGNVLPSAAVTREYFVIVAVTNSDIDRLDTTGEGILSRLAHVPVAGRLFGRYRTRQLTSDERATLKQDKLDERLRTVRKGIDGLYGCHAEPVTPADLALLTAEYWACAPIEYADLERAIGTSPLSTHDTDTRTDAGADDRASEWLPDEPTDESDRDSPEDASGQAPDTASRPLSLTERHQAFVTPSAIDWHTDHAVIDGHAHTRTFWVELFPDHPEDGFLERLLLDGDLRVDLTIHVEPFDTRSALDAISTWISTLQATLDDGDAFRRDDLVDEIERATTIRRLVRSNETGLYRVGVFIRLVAPDRDDLDRKTRQLEVVLRDAPATCVVKRVVRRPEAGLATVSPIGRNELGRARLSTMTGTALGATFPFSSNTLQMPDGIEYGLHGFTGSPLRVDPWALETGHSELVTGMPGSGKTHAAQARSLRMLMRRPDVRQVIIDPVGDMRGTARALDARTITVSGTTPINPCEMHPTPPDLLKRSQDMEPVAAKKAEVYAVIENFLASRGVALDVHSGIVSYAIDTAYDHSGIDPDDTSTHTPANSPTMQDVLRIIDDVADDPARHDLVDSPRAADRVATFATDLAVALQPFRPGGTYANLSKPSGVDVLTGDSRVVYIDLQQVEGTSDGLGKQSFIMQLLLGLVYQQAKRTEDPVEVYIDEARYLFVDNANLSFLNQLARHQRHAGIRLIFLSQTLREFYDAGAAEAIVGMCPIRIHHREPGLDDETARKAGLSEDQQWFVQNAQAGSPTTGYSEALLRVDGHGEYPHLVVTSPDERLVVEYDADAQAVFDAILTGEFDGTARMRDLLHSEHARDVLAAAGLRDQAIEHILEDGLSEDDLLRALCRGLAYERENTVTTTDGGSTDADNDSERSTDALTDDDRTDADVQGDHD